VKQTPATDPVDPRYFDANDLRSEAERVFSLCADCRMCVKFCGSFPKIFNAIDGYCTEEKYAEVDSKKLRAGDIDEAVDLCFQCKLCYIKCPYTPGNHDWAIDFPRLIARAKAQRVKEKGVPLVDRVLGNPDLVGRLGTTASALANWANESKLHRRFMQSLVGIHKDKKLPPFAPKTLTAQFAARRQAPRGEPAARVAFFSTCYVNYNQPEIGLDTLEVMRATTLMSLSPTSAAAACRSGTTAIWTERLSRRKQTCRICSVSSTRVEPSWRPIPLVPK